MLSRQFCPGNDPFAYDVTSLNSALTEAKARLEIQTLKGKATLGLGVSRTNVIGIKASRYGTRVKNVRIEKGMKAITVGKQNKTNMNSNVPFYCFLF